MNKSSTNYEISKSDINELLKQNQEFKELLTEQQNEIHYIYLQSVLSHK